MLTELLSHSNNTLNANTSVHSGHCELTHGQNELWHNCEHSITLRWSKLSPQHFWDRAAFSTSTHAAFEIPYRPFSDPIKTRLAPGWTFSITCPFHALFLWPCQSLWNPAASLPGLLPQARQFSAPPTNPLLWCLPLTKTRKQPNRAIKH